MATVKVCDAAMGYGKSSSAITYMNEHPDMRWIYITPYLDECKRIKKACPKLRFVEPSAIVEHKHSNKTTHTAELIKEGKNITTTHQAFKNYNPDMLEDIRKYHYSVIIDENVEVLERYEIHPDDLKMALDAGYVEEIDCKYYIKNDDYKGVVLADMFKLIKSRDLVHIQDEEHNELFYWALPPSLITSFDEVMILTYMFEGQSLHHFLNIYDIPYDMIHVTMCEDGQYRFCNEGGTVPDYVRDITSKIHVLDNDKMNAIGDQYFDLSMNWFKRGGEPVEQLKKNIYNYFNNICGKAGVKKRLWGSYKKVESKLKGKGYSNAYLTFNCRATNEYRERDVLVYAANPFMNVAEKRFYELHGIQIDEDTYSLSIMIQWIWRSAIRDGKEIYIYIPSRRMREMFLRWMNNLGKEVLASDE